MSESDEPPLPPPEPVLPKLVPAGPSARGSRPRRRCRAFRALLAQAATPPRGQPPRDSCDPVGPAHDDARLLVPATERADADAAVDRALNDISGGDPAGPRKLRARPHTRGSNLAGGPPPPPPASAKTAPGLSEPEISIVELAEAADAETEDGEEPNVRVMAIDEPGKVTTVVEDGSARVVEILKETSSQTITLTVDEPTGGRYRRRAHRGLLAPEEEARADRQLRPTATVGCTRSGRRRYRRARCARRP